MNRRTLLGSISSGLATTLSGCSSFFKSESKTTQSPDGGTPTDSDLDGVSDSEDYAPWDDAVQNKSDVIDDYWGRNITPKDSSDTPIETVFSRNNSISARDVSDGTSSLNQSGMSTITKYSPSEVTVTLTKHDRPSTSHRVLIVAREFPRRGVIAGGVSPPLTGKGDENVSISFQNISSDSQLYYEAYLIPDRNLDSLDASAMSYLHETSPFTISSSGEMSMVVTDNVLTSDSSDSFTRVPVEGGYIITIHGRTNGTDWVISYFVSQAAYERKRLEPRGRRREEYVRYALGTGTGGVFADIIEFTATQHGFSSRREQAIFAVDVVQSLPYVKDGISTGYDDYTKFIEETLTEVRGDCEDSTIVLATVLGELGFDTVLVEFPSHIGVGVAGEFEGSYVIHESQNYYYIETTSPGWGIGDLPKNLDTDDVKVSAV